MSITDSLVQLAVDEGRETGIQAAQDMQLALESITESTRNETERLAAQLLLHRVNEAIEKILGSEHRHADGPPYDAATATGMYDRDF